MIDKAFAWAEANGKLRINKIHGEPEAFLVLSEGFALTSTDVEETEQCGNIAVEDGDVLSFLSSLHAWIHCTIRVDAHKTPKMVQGLNLSNSTLLSGIEVVSRMKLALCWIAIFLTSTNPIRQPCCQVSLQPAAAVALEAPQAARARLIRAKS